MKNFRNVLVALSLVLFSSNAFAQSEPTLSTDKPMYTAGETITFTGAHWAPGEPVSISIDTGEESAAITIEAVADSSGAFTTTALMPDDRVTTASMVRTAGHVVLPEASENANYHATAKGAISNKSAETTFTEGEIETDGARLLQFEEYWNQRLTYPTGKFNPGWVRKAAEQDKKVPRGTPHGRKRGNHDRSGRG